MTNEKLEWATEEETADPPAEVLPVPCGYRVLVRPLPAVTKTKSGILLPDKARDEGARATNIGRVVAVGPQAFNRPDMGEVWYGVGDFVVFPAFGPLRLEVDGVKMLLMNDDEAMAVIPAPERVKHGYFG